LRYRVLCDRCRFVECGSRAPNTRSMTSRDALALAACALWAIQGPRHRAGAHDAGSRVASQVRNSPKKLTPAPYEVPAHVVKPWTSAGLAGQAVGPRGSILRQQWRKDFDWVQEGRF